jgi:hypothetical protein
VQDGIVADHHSANEKVIQGMVVAKDTPEPWQ